MGMKLTSKLGLTFINCLLDSVFMTEVEIITVSKKGQIVLPKKIRSHLKITQGTKLLLVEEKGKINLKKVDELLKKKKSKEKLFTLLASEKSLAKDWLSKEEEKEWKDL